MIFQDKFAVDYSLGEFYAASSKLKL